MLISAKFPEKLRRKPILLIKFKKVIEQSFMGPYYTSVERLSPSQLWSPVGKRSVDEGI